MSVFRHGRPHRRGGGRWLALVVYVLTAWTATDLAAPQGDDVFQGVACATEVRTQLAAWGADGEWWREADGPFGARVLRAPTGRVGVWVTLEVAPTGSVTASRIDPFETRRVSWMPGCEVEARDEATLLPDVVDGSVLTDADLETLIASGVSGAIYVWSPHMPLSVDGYGAIRVAAERLGAVLIPVLDPAADRRYAAAAARRAGLPDHALRPFRSVELTLRTMTVHAPTVLLFGDGRFVGPPLPGYREAEAYTAFMDRHLPR